MCIEAVHRCLFVFDSCPDQYKTQEICDLVVSSYPSVIVYCPDKYITEKMCNEAVSDSLATLRLILNWFVTIKMIIKLYTALYTDENILYCNEDSGDAAFVCNEMSILSINSIKLDNNFDGDNPDPIILIWLLTWDSKSQKHKALKKRWLKN